MYQTHFGLSGEPFSLTPDPDFLFPSRQHREAMAALEYGLMDRRGFITLTGEVGTGKTTILYSVLSQLGYGASGEHGAAIAAAYMPYAPNCFDDLLATALRDLGETPPRDASRATLIEIFQSMLLRRDAAGQRTALVIDEAHGLSDDTFEQLRLLSNFETYTHKLLQIVLVGQPELSDRLREQHLRQLRERVSVRAVINPLEARSMHAYIGHRLARVGGDASLFEPAALRAIIRRAAGIPRRANILCHNALLFTFGHGLERVSARAAREAIAEMDERDGGRWSRPALRRLPVAGEGWRWWALRLGVPVAASIAFVIAAGARSGVPSAGVPSGQSPAALVPAANRDVAPASVAPTAFDLCVGDGAADVTPAVHAQPSARPERRHLRAPQDAPRLVRIPRGGTILGAARALYGSAPMDKRVTVGLLREVRRLNPDIRDVDFVAVGAPVAFPPVIPGTALAGRGAE